ncbi:MAG: pyridoxal 5'-phosphate synthase glutaminase subunit PdxT [Clostridiales bacterium]|nr:pyridoxal 5'-phosphate synthase glutaminase subunit PdxT [Clostridiales bacterium]
MKIGILAVQGAFIEHERILSQLGVECVELRQASDISELDGLVLPGGESTVQGKLLHELNMFEPMKQLITDGLPTLATCAGLILLAEHISNDSIVHLGTLPVRVKRNAYGRQLGSFRKKDNFKGIGEFEMTFIRAPYIEFAGTTEVLATVDERIVAVKHKNQIGLAFHPELGEDLRIHQMFVKMCKESSPHN